MRRVLHFIIDLADGILGALLYGNMGGLTYTNTSLEAQNQHKLRSWAANPPTDTNTSVASAAGVDDDELTSEQRILRFRARTRQIE